LLIDEIENLEADCGNALCTTAGQKAVYAKSRQLELLQKLADLSLTPKEWQRYNALRPAVAQMVEPFEIVGPFEKFYSLAESRNGAICTRFLKAMKIQPSRVSILV